MVSQKFALGKYPHLSPRSAVSKCEAIQRMAILPADDEWTSMVGRKLDHALLPVAAEAKAKRARTDVASCTESQRDAMHDAACLSSEPDLADGLTHILTALQEEQDQPPLRGLRKGPARASPPPPAATPPPPPPRSVAVAAAASWAAREAAAKARRIEARREAARREAALHRRRRAMAIANAYGSNLSATPSYALVERSLRGGSFGSPGKSSPTKLSPTKLSPAGSQKGARSRLPPAHHHGLPPMPPPLLPRRGAPLATALMTAPDELAEAVRPSPLVKFVAPASHAPKHASASASALLSQQLRPSADSQIEAYAAAAAAATAARDREVAAALAAKQQRAERMEQLQGIALGSPRLRKRAALLGKVNMLRGAAKASAAPKQQLDVATSVAIRKWPDLSPRSAVEKESYVQGLAALPPGATFSLELNPRDCEFY